MLRCPMVQISGSSERHSSTPPDDAVPFVLYATVSDGYFQTLQIPLLSGRTFGTEDHAQAPPVAVAPVFNDPPEFEALTLAVALPPLPAGPPPPNFVPPAPPVGSGAGVALSGGAPPRHSLAAED